MFLHNVVHHHLCENHNGQLNSSGFPACVCCKPLVSNAGATAYSTAYFGRGTGGIFLDNLYCTGRESRLVDCTHNGIGVHNCDHSADAGLRCQGIPSIYLSRKCICISLLYNYNVTKCISLTLKTLLLIEQTFVHAILYVTILCIKRSRLLC